MSKKEVQPIPVDPKTVKAMAVWELSDETLEAIKNAKMDPRHDHLNMLLDDEDE